MTHDELLAKINANLCEKEGCDSEHYKKDGLNAGWFALRAVVKRHRPDEIKSISGEVLDTYCFECTDCQYYPCPTIQDITEQLK